MKHITLSLILLATSSTISTQTSDETLGTLLEQFCNKTRILHIAYILTNTIQKMHHRSQIVPLIVLLLITIAGTYSAYRGIKRTYQAFKNSKETLEIFEKNQDTKINYRALPRNVIESSVALVAAFYGTAIAIIPSLMVLDIIRPNDYYYY